MRAHGAGDPRAEAVGPHDQAPGELEAAVATAGEDARDPAVPRPGDALDRDARPNVGARGAGGLDEERVEHGAPGGDQGVDPVARPEPAGHDAVGVVEGDVAEGRGARCEHLLEEAPAPELHDAAPGDGVGRERVRRERGAVDEHDVVAGAGEEQGRGRPGAAGADHDDVVPLGGAGGGGHRQVSCPAGEAHRRLPDDDDPAPVLALGACVESAWRHLPPRCLARGRDVPNSRSVYACAHASAHSAGRRSGRGARSAVRSSPTQQLRRRADPPSARGRATVG